MFKKIFIVLIVLIALFVGVGLLLPHDYTVSRSVTIEANPETIHAYVGDLKRWDEWTPWKEEDPSIQVTLGEKTTGVGARQTWTGKSGKGELTFTQADPSKGVAYDMNFDEGKYKSTGAVRYEPTGEATTVIWTMEGSMDGIVGGYFVLMMDSAVGPMFEKGLKKLKDRVE